jgi:multiple sugar transport system permease protein
MIGPIIWVILTALVPEVELVDFGKHLIPPSHFSLEAFNAALFNPEINLIYSMQATFTYSIIIAILVTLVGTLAAFAFTFTDFLWKVQIFLSLYAIATIPGWSIAIPLYMQMRITGLWNTYLALIFVIGGFILPFSTWILTSFLQSIPRALYEASLVDGATRIQALFKIMLPLAAPGLVVVLIYSFISAWGDFGWALVLTGGDWPLTVKLSEPVGYFTIRYDLMCAEGVIALLPPVILALIFEKWIIKGLIGGAIKG